MKINGVLTHFHNMQIFKLPAFNNKQTHCCTRCKENPFCEENSYIYIHRQQQMVFSLLYIRNTIRHLMQMTKESFVLLLRVEKYV